MIVSASQFKTYLRCRRAWWFEKVHKLEAFRATEPEGTLFGSKLHEVLERWLRADNAGRDPDTGEPVDLYPAGWAGELSEELQGRLKVLVTEAIEKGIVKRYPGRRIEHDFAMEIVPGRVAVQGYVDMLLPGGVIDHKSSVSSRYALTEEKLSTDTQMLVYGKLLDRPELPDGHPARLTHTFFPRKEGAPRKTTGAVGMGAVRAKWKELQNTAQEMLDLKERRLPVAGWDEVDTCAAGSKALGEHCNAFVGCPYMPICTRRETPSQFTQRQERLAVDMTLRDRIRKKKEAATTTVAESDATEDQHSTAAPKLATTKAPAAAAPSPRAIRVLHKAVPSKIQGKSYHSHELLKLTVESEGATLSEFYGKDTWARKDALRLAAEKFLPTLSPCTMIFGSEIQGDEVALLAVAKSIADEVIEGVA